MFLGLGGSLRSTLVTNESYELEEWLSLFIPVVLKKIKRNGVWATTARLTLPDTLALALPMLMEEMGQGRRWAA